MTTPKTDGEVITGAIVWAFGDLRVEVDIGARVSTVRSGGFVVYSVEGDPMLAGKMAAGIAYHIIRRHHAPQQIPVPHP